MNLQTLATEIYAINKANGWHNGEPRSWAEICMLIESEIGGEAVEALRDPKHAVNEIWYREDGKPEGFVTEIADGVIRLLDGMVEKGIRVINDILLPGEDATPCNHDELVKLVRRLGLQTYDIEEPNRCNGGGDYDEMRAKECVYFFRWSFDLIRALGHDPEKVIREKMAYNKTRGDRHGGKRL